MRLWLPSWGERVDLDAPPKNLALKDLLQSPRPLRWWWGLCGGLETSQTHSTHEHAAITCPACLVRLDELTGADKVFVWKPARPKDVIRPVLSLFRTPGHRPDPNGQGMVIQRLPDTMFSAKHHALQHLLRGMNETAILNSLRLLDAHSIVARPTYGAVTVHGSRDAGITTFREVQPEWFELVPYPGHCRSPGNAPLFLPPVENPFPSALERGLLPPH